MRILGIDTSLTGTGLAMIDVLDMEDDNPLAAYIAQTATAKAPGPTKDKSKAAMVHRVEALLAQIDAVFTDGEEPIDAVGIEGLAYSAGNASAWVLAWVWGETIRLCVKHKKPLTVVATSARAKYATGKGNAGKDEVLLAASKAFPHAGITDNNQADALIVGAVVCHQLGYPILPVTQYRLDVLPKLGN
jgi:Holliday junction resolvasome RuvABC endonuclease subunit